jgi:UPF0755 protein
MIPVMLARFASAAQDARLQEGLARQNFSLHQAVTLASIIERETRADEEKARIASVFTTVWLPICAWKPTRLCSTRLALTALRARGGKARCPWTIWP